MYPNLNLHPTNRLPTATPHATQEAASGIHEGGNPICLGFDPGQGRRVAHARDMRWLLVVRYVLRR